MIKIIIISFGAFILSSTSYALNLTYQTTLDIAHSDNVTRVPDNTISDVYTNFGVGVSLDEENNDLTMGLLARWNAISYRDNTFPDDNFFRADFNTEWRISPERFSWFVEDVYGQVLVNEFSATTIDNLQNRNFFSTGPDIILGSRENVEFRIGYRYQDNYYEVTNIDNTRDNVNLILTHAFNPSTSIGFHGEYFNVKYDDNINNTDNERYNAFLRYIRQNISTIWQIDLGVTDIQNDSNIDINEPLFRLEYTRRLNTTSRARLILRREIVFDQERFNNVRIGDVGDVLDESATSDLSTNKEAGVSYEFDDRVHRFLLRYLYRQDEFKTDIIRDRDINELVLSGIYQTRANFLFDYSALYTKTDFFRLPRVDKDTDFRLGVSYQIRSNLRTGLAVTNTKRDSTVSTADYEENRVMLNLTYGAIDLR